MRLWILLIVLLAANAHALQITEIMYNPDGSDGGREWVEILNNESEVLNLSGMKFYESGTNHKTELINGNILLNERDYALIIDKPDDFFADYPDIETSNIAVLDSSFSLSNSGEYLAFKLDDKIIADINYSAEADEGYSLALYDSGWNSSKEIGGSPGEEDEKEEIINDTGKCDISIQIETEKIIFENKETIKYKHRLANLCDEQKYDYIIEYWIDDLFNNTIRAKRNTTNVNKKSWTPNIDDKLSAAVLKARVYPECNDTDLSNNYDGKLVVIKNSITHYILPDICNVSFGIDIDKSLFENKETLKFKHNLHGAENYTIEYWIEDAYSDILRSRKNTTNTNKKSFTPNIKEKEKAFFLKAIAYSECGEAYAERFFVVANKDYSDTILNTVAAENKVKIGIEYKIDDLASEIQQNSSLEFRVNIINDDENHSFRIYSYMYSGGKCISDNGNRTANEKIVDIDAGKTEEIEMVNFIPDYKPGDYKLKVMIFKDDQKTAKQLIRHVSLKETKSIISVNLPVLNKNPYYSGIKNITPSPQISANKQENGVIYKGKDMKIKDSMSYYMIGFLSLSLVLSSGRWKIS